MQEHHLQVKRTARYYTVGSLNEHTRQVWFVLHGYGQLAQYFIKKFMALPQESIFVVAPEGLSRFYLDGVSGRVGASWITRENKENEVSDYLAYLNDLYDNILNNKDLGNIEVVVFGFSQGTATALRWLNDGHIGCHHLVLWAGYFANGITDLITPEKLAAVPVSVVYGTQDEYLVQIDLKKFEADIRTNAPHATITTFEGKHTIDTDTLLQMPIIGH